MDEIFDGAGDDVGAQGEAKRAEGDFVALGYGEIGLHVSMAKIKGLFWNGS